MRLIPVVSWQGKRAIAPNRGVVNFYCTLNFSLLENFLLVEKSSSENEKFWAGI